MRVVSFSAHLSFVTCMFACCSDDHVAKRASWVVFLWMFALHSYDVLTRWMPYQSIWGVLLTITVFWLVLFTVRLVLADMTEAEKEAAAAAANNAEHDADVPMAEAHADGHKDQLSPTAESLESGEEKQAQSDDLWSHRMDDSDEPGLFLGGPHFESEAEPWDHAPTLAPPRKMRDDSRINI